jgi:hypothetical protein
MDAATVMAMLQQHFENTRSDSERAHAMYHEDAVLEFPQSGERFEGVENFREWRSNYPAATTYEFREVRGQGTCGSRRSQSATTRARRTLG